MGISDQANPGTIDCILVGYNELDYRRRETHLQQTKEYSGAHRFNEFELMYFRGQKRQYMEVFDLVGNRNQQESERLNVYKLPALGVTYLTNFLALRGWRVDCVNFFNDDKERFEEMLAQSPRAVAITTTFYVENSPIIDIVEFVRRHSPKTKIIVGGPRIYNLCSQPDPMAQDFELETIGADFYVYDSQGELTLSRILEQLSRGEDADFSQVSNLVYVSRNGKLERTARQIEANDMEQNAIDWNRFDSELYVPTTLMRTARSCAFCCSFCSYPVMAGPLNLRSVKNVECELRQLREAGVKQIVFIDDTFNVPLSRFKDLCRMMIDNRFEFEWFSYFRCSNSDEETFPLMADSGCKGVFLGIESGDQTILNNMKKCVTIEKYENGIRWLKENGIVTFVSIIVGFPGESWQTVRNTMDFLQRTSPMFYRAELYYHSTNVPIHERAADFGLTGAAYSWRHRSMDWRQACDAIEMIYETIRGPVVLPHGFDLWSIPYLLGQGFTIEQIERFASVAQQMLAYRFKNGVPHLPDYEDRLDEIFADQAVA